MGFHLKTCLVFSTLSSRQRMWARGQVWALPRCTALSSNTRVGLRCPVRLAPARFSKFFSRSWRLSFRLSTIRRLKPVCRTICIESRRKLIYFEIGFMPEIIAETSKDYSWAEYLDCMEGGSDILTLQPTKPPAVAVIEHPLYGLSIALLLTLIAMWLSEVPIWPFTLPGGRHPIEAVMMAIILGMILSNIWTLPKSRGSGIKFSVKKILPLGIIFLGARLDFTSILKIGVQ